MTCKFVTKLRNKEALQRMYLPKTPFIAKKIFPKLTWEQNTAAKNLYLSFDDGPTPRVTEWVLRTLNQFNASATFFCLGKNVVLYPDLFEEILKAGHQVGNHTYNHLNAWKTKEDVFLNDVQSCEKVFHSKLFRPPYGKLKPGIQKKIMQQFEIVMWDIISYDFDNNLTGDEVLQNVIQHAKSGSIIVFHDSLKAEKHLRYALPKVLEHFSKLDYNFMPILHK